MPVLTERGRRAEKYLEKLERRKDRLMQEPWSYSRDRERDRIDEQIDRIEGNFAYGEGGYYKVRAHPRKGSRRGVRGHVRRR
jgi:hypothetical protein